MKLLLKHLYWYAIILQKKQIKVKLYIFIEVLLVFFETYHFDPNKICNFSNILNKFRKNLSIHPYIVMNSTI